MLGTNHSAGTYTENMEDGQSMHRDENAPLVKFQKYKPSNLAGGCVWWEEVVKTQF